MSIISSISKETTTQTGSSSALRSAQAKSQSQGTDEQTETNARKVSLSDRAQKIQKLNEEFFPEGPRSLRITSDFIQRLQEYGFLSGDEAQSLNNQQQRLEQNSASSAGSHLGVLGELADFAESFKTQLQQQDPQDPMIATLSKAQSIINNLDNTQQSSLTSDIKTVFAELNQYLNNSDSITAAQKDKLEQLGLALNIADKMNPANLSSNRVNNYLKVMDGLL